jgi:hypothetical protein
MDTLNDTTAAVGSILYTSWGYDQTNYDFYQVVERRGTSTIVLRKLAVESENEGWCRDKVKPRKDVFIERDEPLVRRINKHGRARIESYSCLYPWDGLPKHATSYA